MGVLKHTALLTGALLLLGIAALSPVTEGRAQSTAGNPLVSGSIVRDYARITFYWPEKIDMTATTDGRRLLVNFDRQVNPNFGTILSKLYPYVQKADLAANRRTIVFTMQKPYRIRSFITDSESGVDILDIHDTPPPAPEQQTATAPPKPAPVKPAPVKPAPAVRTQPVVDAPVPRRKPDTPSEQSSPSPKPQRVDTPEPAEVAAAPVITPEPVRDAPAPQPEPTPQPQPEKEAAPVIDLPAPAPVVATPAPVEPVVTAALPQATPVAAVETPKIARMQNFGRISGEQLVVELRMVEKDPHLRFPFTERVAAAVWQRGRTIMVLFDKPVVLTGLEQVEATGRSWLRKATQLGGSEFTLLRLDLTTDLYIQSFKDREGYGWQLRVSGDRVYPQENITPVTRTTSGLKEVFLPTTQIGTTYHLHDPQVGDALDVTTLYAGDRGVFPPRSFIDFSLLTTQQGIAVAPKSDAVQVTQLENGVRVSAPDGLFISENIDEAVAKAAGTWDDRNELFKPTLFPAREWRVDGTEAFHEREAYLMNRIAAAPSGLVKNTARMELAQLYFSQELYNETLGVVNTIRRDDLDFFRANKLAALEGAAYLLNYRIPEAALSFSSDTLDNMEEGELLRKAAAASLDSNAPPVPYLQYNDHYVRQYPSALRQRLAIIAANHAIQQKDFRSPADIFESLDEDKLTGEVADYIDYLKAKVAAAAGRIEEAERIWGKLAGKIEDRQFRARSEYSLVLLGLEEGTLTPEKAIERLEALRIVWRGDDLERSLLSVLGQLQVNQGNYWEGMKAWEELLENYPNHPDALAAYQRLAETFRMLFMENGADKMEPVKALALYNEFQELTPLGKDGNTLIQRMVDRLVGVDLLEEGAKRLENQVQYRLEGEEKSRVGARLAVIYLLDREPEKALNALQQSRVDNVPASLSLERNRIAAQALVDLGRPDQALTMIEGDYSPEGENVRLETYWAKEDWPYVIDIIELMLRKRTDLDAPFTPQEGQRLLQLSLAYIFVGEFEQLQYLRDAYAPLMKGNTYEDEFLFLTQERIPTNSENFSKVTESIGEIESFMGGYRAKLKKEGLSEAVGNTDNEDANATPPENPQ